MFFLNPANHIRLFSVILVSNIDLGYIHWALTPFQLKKFQLTFSQYVYYIIWESHSSKIIVARLLKRTVSYPEVYLYRWVTMGTQILSPNFLEKGFLKKPSTSWEVKFLDNVVTLSSLKKWTQTPTMVEGLQFHSSTQ